MELPMPIPKKATKESTTTKLLGADVNQPSCSTLSENSDLYKIGLRYGTDKITVHGYHRIFPRFIDQYRSMAEGAAVLEIGVLNKDSLRVWLDYFPNHHIYGLDIEEVKADDHPRQTIFRANQCDPKDMEDVVSKIKHPVCFINDDGSHVPEHQLFSFDYLFHELLMPGGTYIIEDVETSYWANGAYFSGHRFYYGYKHQNNVVEIFKDVADEVNSLFLNTASQGMVNERLSNKLSINTRKNIASVTFAYNSIIICKKTEEDKLYGNDEYRFYDNL